MSFLKIALFTSLTLTPLTVFAGTGEDLAQMFPERVGNLRRVGEPKPPDPAKQQGLPNPNVDSSSLLQGLVEYVDNDNERFLVEAGRYRQDAQAYSALTVAAASARAQDPKTELETDFGTASFANDLQIVFFKGLYLVRITKAKGGRSGSLDSLARLLSNNFDKGEADVPALVKHLPNPELAQKRAIFLTRFSELGSVLSGQTVGTAIETGGDADAAFVEMSTGKVLLVEYNTPQLAKENDDRIIAKIHELWKLGQPAPIGYRRVGNYSVFVFDSPDEVTAKQLIDQVKYEQVVQWLGENPNILKEAQRRYVETTLGVFIAVLKASGFALIGCLGLGGLLGALLFSRRRAQTRAREAFSDAGGMLRLNIDELTSQTDPARLLGPGR